jgi:hypothetical protein
MKVVKQLIALEKRANTLRAKAKSGTEVSAANSMLFRARILRASLVAQNMIGATV